jgi:hypothetical protein
VPCVGTDLQGRCKLLGDARDAQALVPDARPYPATQPPAHKNSHHPDGSRLATADDSYARRPDNICATWPLLRHGMESCDRLHRGSPS